MSLAVSVVTVGAFTLFQNRYYGLVSVMYVPLF